MTTKSEFDAVSATWPNADSSQFVSAGSILWHVQVFPQPSENAPKILLLHGTGASMHSWAPILPYLIGQYSVIAIDLPGHGFTERPATSQLSLEGMSKLIQKLCEKLEFSPDLVVGHSAGAAIATHMSLGKMIAPRGVVSIAGAFMPIGGPNNGLFSLAAKLLAGNPFVSRIFAWRARNPEIVRELMDRTGSKIKPEVYDQYAVLARNKRHVASALGMMANWDLRRLNRSLSNLEPALLILTGENDTMIPAADGEAVKGMVPGAELKQLSDVGHLLHEEAPSVVATLINEFADKLMKGAEE